MEVVAQVEQGVDRAAADLVDQVRRQVVLRRLLIRARQRERQPLRQLQLEFMPAVITERAAETHHGRLGYHSVLHN